MHKNLYTHFLAQSPGWLHFTAHSHHFWPDITREAVLEYWDDTAKLKDHKWDRIYDIIIPETQKLIAAHLNLPKPENIIFGPSLHDLILRFFSCWSFKKSIKVLSTDCEFYSASRQFLAFKQIGLINLRQEPVHPIENLTERLSSQIKSQKPQFVFLSHVFFNNSLQLQNLEQIAATCAENKATLFIDGYHGFMAIPTDLSKIADKSFYAAGGYKYAQGGEGCCFMAVPDEFELYPAITGWHAELNAAETLQKPLIYPSGPQRFLGSTFDVSGIYRLRASLQLFHDNGINVEAIHAHAEHLKSIFRELWNADFNSHPLFKNAVLNPSPEIPQGNFLCIEFNDESRAQKTSTVLKHLKIAHDRRGSALRFGFGLYHDPDDVTAFFGRINLLNTSF